MIEVHPSICRLCPAHCPILVEVDDGRAVKVKGDPSNDLYNGYTCPKGRALPEMHSHPGRLHTSLKRDADGVRQPIEIGQAMDEIAERISAIVAEHGPRSVALYIGTGMIGQPVGPRFASVWLYGLGSSMAFNPTTIDQPGKHVALALHGRWQADEDGFEEADSWLIAGLNPVVTKSNGVPNQNPSRKINEAVQRGMQLVVIDPRRTETARSAAVHLQARPGEDPTILAGLLRIIVAEGLYDEDFVAENTTGFADLVSAVEPYTPDYVSARAGIAEEDLVRAARIFGGKKRGCAVAGTGPSFATRGTLTEYLLLCLNTICGRWARAGDKVRRPNVMLPAYTARAQPYPPYPAWGSGEKMRVRGLEGSTCGNPTAALADEILLEGEGQVRVLICAGGNPMMAWPDQRRTFAAMEKLELLVTIDPELSATSQLADYVIAPRMSLETPGMSYLNESLKYLTIGLGYDRPWAQYSPRIAEPPAGSDLIEEWQFFAGLAKRMGIGMMLPDQYGYGEHIESPMLLVEVDTDDPPTTEQLYEQLLQNSRVPLEEIKRHPNGKIYDEIDERVQPREDGNDDRLELGNADMMRQLGEVRAEDYAAARSHEFPLLLIPRRTQNVVNSIGRSIEKLTGKRPYNPAFMHPDDAAALGISDGQSIQIRSAHDAIPAVAKTDDTLRPGTVAMTHGFGGNPDDDESFREVGSNIGRLISVEDDYDLVSGIPRMGALPISIGPL